MHEIGLTLVASRIPETPLVELSEGDVVAVRLGTGGWIPGVVKQGSSRDVEVFVFFFGTVFDAPPSLEDVGVLRARDALVWCRTLIPDRDDCVVVGRCDPWVPGEWPPLAWVYGSGKRPEITVFLFHGGFMEDPESQETVQMPTEEALTLIPQIEGYRKFDFNGNGLFSWASLQTKLTRILDPVGAVAWEAALEAAEAGVVPVVEGPPVIPDAVEVHPHRTEDSVEIHFLMTDEEPTRDDDEIVFVVSGAVESLAVLDGHEAGSDDYVVFLDSAGGSADMILEAAVEALRAGSFRQFVPHYAVLRSPEPLTARIIPL